MRQQALPPGFWPSLLSAEMVAKGKNALSFPLGAGDWLFWQENLADQGNRCVLRGRPIDQNQPVQQFSADDHALGSRVHEYGGCAYAVAVINGRLVAAYVNKADQALYVCHDLWQARQWQKVFWREHAALGDIQLCPWGVVFVLEQHVPDSATMPENMLIFCDWQGHTTSLHRGEDFYAGLQFADDFSCLAFLSWRRPHMPWDQSALWMIAVDADGEFAAAQSVWAQPGVAVFQPMFDGQNRLYYVADTQGFAQLYRYDDGYCLCDQAWEFSLPLWQLGMRVYAVRQDGVIVACAADQGVWRLGYLYTSLDTQAEWREISLEGAHVAQPVAVGAGFAALIMPPDDDEYIAYFAPESNDEITHAKQTELYQARIIAHAQGGATPECSSPPRKPWVIKPTPHHFAGQYGSVQGYWYLPSGLGDRPPPVIIRCHGGPSGQTDAAYRAKYQYWLSRGFALFDINYSGSTGFGRAYRQRLVQGWGVVDRDDCLDGLRDLLRRGWVDGDHAFISGSSAGGLTALNCLCHSDLFAGGVSVYGVADLIGLARTTHKFEADYLQTLIGPLPAAQQTYIARSPLYHAQNIRAPMLFLHGGKDPVVPLSQMLDMVTAIRAENPQAMIEIEIFPEEGHGFRDPQTVSLALERECAFYRRLLQQ